MRESSGARMTPRITLTFRSRTVSRLSSTQGSKLQLSPYLFVCHVRCSMSSGCSPTRKTFLTSRLSKCILRRRSKRSERQGNRWQKAFLLNRNRSLSLPAPTNAVFSFEFLVVELTQHSKLTTQNWIGGRSEEHTSEL